MGTEQRTTSLADELKATFLFEPFSDEQLRWVTERAAVVPFAAGEQIFPEGVMTDALWVLLSGEWRLSRTVSGREIVLEVSSQPGSWAGWLPVFDETPAVGARMLQSGRLLRIGRDAVREMLAGGFPVAGHLLAGVYGGVTNFEALTRQQEKLAALGKLSAGLAHELNNPAAAAGRAASQLRARLRERDDRALAVGRRLDEAGAAALAALGREAVDRAPAALPLAPLARSDREDELAGWLDDRGIAEGWELTPTLVAAGIGPADLEALAGRIDAAVLPDALAWLGATLAVDSLAGEVEGSAARISEMVGAIKEYSHMDRAQEQELDLHDGLESTITMLKHKLRAGDVEVVREYDLGLPHVAAHGGELNQVWTNLLDNAIDALAGVPPGTRRITIRTTCDGERALVEIADNGPGVPPEIRPRIFEPFFTTKGVGEGSGLGLDISYRIVVRQHGGDLRVESVPGDTRFQVRLPVVSSQKVRD